MKRKLGLFLIALGCGLFAAALGLLIRNQMEQQTAFAASQSAIVKVVEAIRENAEQTIHSTAPNTAPGEIPEPTLPAQRAMTVVDIEGYGYIGFVGIPAVELELPVMADWSYSQLQIAPCRYYGSTFGDDLVIMAHNYGQFFGKLMDVKPGDEVTFTDMDGETVRYRVTVVDLLHRTAVEDMIDEHYDLTLFTCTYGGENRVTVRCDRIEKPD